MRTETRVRMLDSTLRNFFYSLPMLLSMKVLLKYLLAGAVVAMFPGRTCN